MNAIALPALVILAAATSCQSGQPSPSTESDVQTKTLGAEIAQARFRLGGSLAAATLVIEPNSDAAGKATYFNIYFDQSKLVAQSVALFPPDQPGRFMVKVPAGTREMRVELAGEDKAVAPDYIVRLE